jgi:hypothetical protein
MFKHTASTAAIPCYTCEPFNAQPLPRGSGDADVPAAAGTRRCGVLVHIAHYSCTNMLDLQHRKAGVTLVQAVS